MFDSKTTTGLVIHWLNVIITVQLYFSLLVFAIEEDQAGPLVIHSRGASAVILSSHTGCRVSYLNSSTVQGESGEAVLNLMPRNSPWLAKSSHAQDYNISEELLSELVELCENDSKRESPTPLHMITNVREHTRFLYPGTKYCGSGNASSGPGDLGECLKTDRCCLEHDSCQDFIPGRTCSRSKRLCNRTPFTRSACTCDEKFRQCLLAANETASNKIGQLYFNVFGLQCYRRDYPAVRCTKWGGFLHMHCQSYKLDYTRPKIWQFFDSPMYVPKTKLASDRTDEEIALHWLTLAFKHQQQEQNSAHRRKLSSISPPVN